jgi:hypothetical protein
MSQETAPAEALRESVLSPVDRISELIFGLLMALSFTGAVSVAEAGSADIRAMLIAALGCNLAWGLVDAVMYSVRTFTDRGKSIVLVHSVRAAADARAGHGLIEDSLPRGMADLVSPAEIEAMRVRIVALRSVPERATLGWNDLRAAVAVFLIVVLATFPVVLPFALMQDVGAAKNASRVIALAMLFFAGFGLGRYAGVGGWMAGVTMAGLGTLLVGAIKVLGG